MWDILRSCCCCFISTTDDYDEINEKEKVYYAEGNRFMMNQYDACWVKESLSTNIILYLNIHLYILYI